MTTKDHDPHHPELDAEFEAFLQGQGELADLLRVMPQPRPSAALDAAILADAEAALARGAPPVAAAANDPVIPEAQPAPARSASTFLSRWKVPLGLAASVLLAIPLVMQWQRLPSNESTNLVATAPASPSPAPPVVVAQLEKSVAEPASAKRADKDADFSQLAKADTVAPLRSERRAAPPHADEAGRIAAPAAAVAPAETENKPIVIASAEPSEAKRESFALQRAPRTLTAPVEAAPFPQAPPVAASPPPAPAAAAVKPSALGDTQARLAVEPRDAIGEAAGTELKTRAYGGLAQSEPAQKKSKGSAAPFAESRVQSIASADMAPPPPTAAPAASVAAPTTLYGGADAAGGTMRAAPAAPIAAQPSAPLTTERAKAWLQQIEKLIKADLRKEALEEWTKFRQAYPNYPVQKPLLKQIDILKNEVKR